MRGGGVGVREKKELRMSRQDWYGFQMEIAVKGEKCEKERRKGTQLGMPDILLARNSEDVVGMFCELFARVCGLSRHVKEEEEELADWCPVTPMQQKVDNIGLPVFES